MLRTPDANQQAVSPDGFALTYINLFGDPWEVETEVLPGSLEWLPAGLSINQQGGWKAALMPDVIRKMVPWPGATVGFHTIIQDASNQRDYGKAFSGIDGTITRLMIFSL
jgi:hypothetical protein